MLLPTLASHVPFETAIGLNGRIWLKTSTTSETIALKRIIERVDQGSILLEKSAIEQAVKLCLA